MRGDKTREETMGGEGRVQSSRADRRDDSTAVGLPVLCLRVECFSSFHGCFVFIIKIMNNKKKKYSKNECNALKHMIKKIYHSKVQKK